MSAPRMLTVNRNEILARADELDTPIANPPSDPVKAACGLETAVTGAKQIKLSADNLRTRLAVGAQERHRIAEFMRSAAKAYEDVDGQAAAPCATAEKVPCRPRHSPRTQPQIHRPWPIPRAPALLISRLVSWGIV
ncbi:hypothetical protein OSJ16_25310, partial [Mycobacterium ulcerans]